MINRSGAGAITDRVVTGFFVAAASAFTLAMMGRPAGFLVIALIASYLLWMSRAEWSGAHRIIPVYILAVLVQCAHVAEEYAMGFNRDFPRVFGADPWSGRQFLLFNLVWLAIFVIAGFGLTRRNGAAYVVAMFLAIGGGIGNGLAHLVLSARAGGYFPGLYTGALALIIGSALAYRLAQAP